jgi:hypothetical protein
MLTPVEAEARMRQTFVTAMCRVVSRGMPAGAGYDPEQATESFMWPDALLYERNQGYEPRLMAMIGNALGYHAGAQTRAWFDYAAQHRAEGAQP